MSPVGISVPLSNPFNPFTQPDASLPDGTPVTTGVFTARSRLVPARLNTRLTITSSMRVFVEPWANSVTILKLGITRLPSATIQMITLKLAAGL